MTKFSAIIVAAGEGSRFGGETPKQYLPLRGQPVLRYSLECFLSYPDIDEVQVVIHPDHKDLYKSATEGLEISEPVMGGASRCESVLNGLRAVTGDCVLIHDAARPFLSHEIIDRCIACLNKHEGDGCVPVLPVQDTLRHISGDHPDRSNLVRVQTPQAFSTNKLIKAYEESNLDCTDDAGIYEKCGGKVHHYGGDEKLFKITTQEDYERAVLMMEENIAYRTGHGFDVHKFAQSGDAVILGGISVPHDKALEGHSDADVILHALTDAILGTIGAGDIGEHFPPSDDKWKGADSALFVIEACRQLEEKGGQLVNADITVICESPKLSSYKAKIKENIADLLSMDTEAINIKATTTEGLGFTGRGEGIAAQAIVTVKV